MGNASTTATMKSRPAIAVCGDVCAWVVTVAAKTTSKTGGNLSAERSIEKDMVTINRNCQNG
jgi:hypothetical protein